MADDAARRFAANHLSEFLRKVTPDDGGSASKEELATNTVVQDLLGPEGLETLNDPFFLDEIEDRVPADLVKNVVSRIEALRMHARCQGKWGECQKTISSSFCYKVFVCTGKMDHWKCRACTCPCQYDEDHERELVTCDGYMGQNSCGQKVCESCGEGCACYDV